MILAVFQKRKEKTLFKMVGLLVISQLILALGQITFPSLHKFLVIEFVQDGSGVRRIISEQIILGKVAIGTFIRPANLGNFLAIFIPAIIYFLTGKFKGWRNIIFNFFLIALIWILVQTGIRTSLISFIFFLFFVLWLQGKRKMFGVLSVIVIFFYTISQYFQNVSINFNKNDGFQNPVQRIAYGIIKIFNPETSVIEDSTLVRSANILSQIKDVLFGSAVYAKGGTYHGISSITDATLAFIFVEYGLITFIICFIPFIYPIIFLKIHLLRKKDFKFALALFASLLLQTITDQGFFTVYSSALYFIICGVLIHRNRQQKINSNRSFQ
jgi:hypothetical protein